MQNTSPLKMLSGKALRIGAVFIFATFVAAWLLPVLPLSIFAWLWVETITLAFVGMLLSILFGKQWPLLTRKNRATLLLLLIGSAVFALLGDLTFFTGATLAIVYPNLTVWALGTILALMGAVWLTHSFLETIDYATWGVFFASAMGISITVTLVAFFRLF